MMTVAEAAEMLGVAPDAMMTREEVADFLKVAPRTLADWEKEGRGPPSARISLVRWSIRKRRNRLSRNAHSRFSGRHRAAPSDCGRKTSV